MKIGRLEKGIGVFEEEVSGFQERRLSKTCKLQIQEEMGSALEARSMTARSFQRMENANSHRPRLQLETPALRSYPNLILDSSGLRPRLQRSELRIDKVWERGRQCSCDRIHGRETAGRRCLERARCRHIGEQIANFEAIMTKQ